MILLYVDRCMTSSEQALADRRPVSRSTHVHDISPVHEPGLATLFEAGAAAGDRLRPAVM